jgi:hypothetical protein
VVILQMLYSIYIKEKVPKVLSKFSRIIEITKSLHVLKTKRLYFFFVLLLILGCGKKDTSGKSQVEQNDTVAESEPSQENPEPPWRLGIDAWASWDIDVGMGMYGGGYTYELKLQIGNPYNFPIDFDMVKLKFHRTVTDHYSGLNEARIIFNDTSMVVQYSYGNEVLRDAHTKNDKLHEQRIEAQRALLIPHISLPALVTQPGIEPTRLRVILLRNDTTISYTAKTVLPPILRIPMSYDLYSSGREGFHLLFRTESNLPSGSGIMDRELIIRISQKANEMSSGAKLVEVSPRFLTVHTMIGGGILHTVSVWQYHFRSDSEVFSIYKDDPSVVEEEIRIAEEECTKFLNSKMLNSLRIDADDAVLMAEMAGAHSIESGHFKLLSINLSNNWRPAWLLPYEFDAEPVGILADSGELIAKNIYNGRWHLIEDGLWNR